MNILVTGGAGYIGSHTVIELQKAGHNAVIIDNLCNSSEKVLSRIGQITGKPVKFYCEDLLDREAVERVFSENSFDAVIHFAGLKAVGESVQMPLCYYHNNITGTLILCESMQKYGVKKLVFSSSATVYGDPHTVPIKEDFPLFCTNPYGRTKLMIEEILRDLYVSDPEWNIALLRYFNPVGAHESGLIGEDPNGIPSNLMPYIAQVAIGNLKELSVYGGDYPTPDGTGIRDYIHVVDLARGHLCALKKLAGPAGVETYNLGTGRGYSVFEVLHAYEKASGRKIPYAVSDRRPGDVAQCYADPAKAEQQIGFRTSYTLDDMCRDSWRWQTMNPRGYQ